MKDLLGVYQTPDEQRAVWQQAVETFGLKVRRHDKRRVRILRMPSRESA